MISGDEEQIVYSSVLYAPALKQDIRLVCILWSFKSQKRREVLFSTNLAMSAFEVIECYRARFEMEFPFRDAKRPKPEAILPVRCMVRIKKVLPWGQEAVRWVDGFAITLRTGTRICLECQFFDGQFGSSSVAISPASPINCSTPSEMVGAWLMALVRKQPRANKVTARCSALRDQSQRFKLRLPATRRKYASKDATPQPEPRRWCAAPSGSGFVQPQSPGHGDPVHERCRPCRRGQA